MQKKFLLILAMVAVVICLFVVAVGAETVTVDEVTYTLTAGATEEENTARINSHKKISFTSTELTIPVYVESEDGVKYYVTSMDSAAFEGTNLTKVVFESGCRIEEIGSTCFSNCKSLTTVVLHEGLKHIRNKSFLGDNVLTALYLPASLETIGFFENGNSSVASGESPFAGCSKLFFVNSPEETTKPGTWYAPVGLQRISGEFLKGLNNVNAEIVFGENCNYIENAYAFSKMNSKHTIVLTADFSQPGSMFKYSCETWNLEVRFTHENVVDGSFLRYDTAYAGDNPKQSYIYIFGANIKAVLTKQTVDSPVLEWIPIYQNTTVVVMTPSGEKEITLYDVEILELSESFSLLGFKEFCDPDDPSVTYTKADIVKLYINRTATTIVANVISGMPLLKEIIFEDGSSVVLETGAIASCEALEKITAYGDSIVFSSKTVSSCPKLTVLDIREANVTFNNNAFYQNKVIKQVLMSAGHSYSFGDSSFKQSALTSVEFPDNSTISWSANAFAECVELTYVYFGSNIGVKETSNALFDGASKLEKVVIMDLTKLGQWAFSGKETGKQYGPLCDLTVYIHSESLTLYNNQVFNNRTNGYNVYIYTVQTTIPDTFTSCSYTVYKGIGHAYELEINEQSTCITHGNMSYVTDCPCGIDYRDISFTTYSTIDTTIHGVEHEPHGTEIIYLPLVSHIISDVAYRIEYANGFLSNGITTFACGYCNGEGLTESKPTAKPLFDCLGYSVPEGGEYKSLTQGFSVNREALALYNSLNEGKEIRYGMIAGIERVLNGTTELFENGEKIEGVNCVTFDCTEYGSSFFDMKIIGLEKSNDAVVYADLALYCCAYVLSYDEEEIVSTYLTTGLYGAPVESETLVNPYSFNQVLEAIEYLNDFYVGYDGYIWKGMERTDTLSAPLANNVMENTLELVDNALFTRNNISAGTKVILMGNYFTYANATHYSKATVSKLTTYVSGNGSLDIGKINLATGEYSLISTESVTEGKNIIALSCKLGSNETLVLGGDNTTVGLYSISGVNADDQHGIYSTDTQSFAVSETNGLNDKVIVNVELELSTTEIECITPEREDVYAERTSGYKAVVNSVAPFIYVDPDLFEGRTLKSMKLFVTTVSYSNGYATMDIATLTVPANFYKNKAIPSFNEVYTIKLPAEFFGGATTVNAWYEIDFTKYAYTSDGTQATEGIVVADGETLALNAKASDTVIWGFNDNVFSDVATCEQFYHKSNNLLAFGSSTSVLNFLFYYEKTVSYESVQDHLEYLTELDKAAYVKAELADKQLSILGDSISTFQGYSNDATQGLSQNSVFYNSSFLSVEDTYWYQLMKMYGMNLCVNNSWSGAYASLHTPNVGSNVDRDGSVSSGVIRASKLAKLDGTAPDYILIYIGINDLNNGSVTDEVVCEAYMEILNTVSATYPNAKVFCINLPNRNEGNDPRPINEGIKNAVDEHDNAYLVDLYSSHYSGEKYKYNSSNSSKNTDNLHPNALGMDFMTELIAEVMEEVVASTYGK